MTSTRVSLILRLHSAEDEQAWREFVDLYQPVIQALARRRGLQDADARDVSQEVLSKIATVVHRWSPSPEKGTFRGWLCRITHNMVVDFLRDQRRRPQGTNNIESALIQLPERESRESRMFLLERERHLFLWAASKVRQECKTSTWQAFWRTAVLDQPISEVADSLQMQRGAVYVARSRTMAQIRQHIEGLNSTEMSLLILNSDDLECYS